MIHLKSYRFIYVLFSGELVIIALGTMTNIALALRLDPDFLKRIRHLYIGAGHIYSK